MIEPFNTLHLNNLSKINNIEYFARYPNCPFGKSGNCCKTFMGGIDRSNCGSNSKPKQINVVGKYPNCPFGKSNNCCKNMMGGIDRSNCRSNSKPKQINVVGKYPNCPFGKSNNCCKNMMGGIDRSNCAPRKSIEDKHVKQDDQEDEIETVTETADKIFKIVKKKINIDFIASGTGKKLFFTKNATITGKIVKNKITLSKIIVDGTNELPSQYINKEFVITKNKNIISASFSPSIDVKGIKIYSFEINTNNKTIDINHNDFVDLSQFRYRKKNIFKTETIEIDKSSDESEYESIDEYEDEDDDFSLVEENLSSQIPQNDIQKNIILVAIFLLIFILLFK